MLTRDELERYDRQMVIRGFGREGQEKLKKAKVFIAGAGGLGSAVSTYLAVAGVGTIRIVDYDIVELSNLNRQILYWQDDIGRNKTDPASEKLKRLNPDIKIEAIKEMIIEANVSDLVADCDLIIDGMDNLPTRQLLNKTALQKNIPFIHGAVYGFEGRAMTVIPGETACLSCVYRAEVPRGRCPAVGATPAIIGCIQATEAIKYILGIGELLKNKLLLYDGLNMNFTELNVKKDPECKLCGQPVEGKK